VKTTVTVPIVVCVDVKLDVSWNGENADILKMSLPQIGEIHTTADSLSGDDLEAIDMAVMEKLDIEPGDY